MSVGLAILSTQIWGITEPFQMIERIMTAYAVYEVIVFLILTNRNDIEADSALAYGTYLKKILLYFKSNDSTLKQDILQNRQRQLSVTTLNSPRNYKRYEQSLRWLEERNATQVQYELIRSEHEKEIASLQWRFSFILRLVK